LDLEECFLRKRNSRAGLVKRKRELRTHWNGFFLLFLHILLLPMEVMTFVKELEGMADGEERALEGRALENKCFLPFSLMRLG
jgi:hypothetical protein